MSLLAALALLQAAPAAEPEHWYALGTTPLWQAIFANGYLSFETPGRAAVNVQAPPRQESAQGYAWRTAEVSIIVTRGTCVDALSHRVFTERVTVESAGRRYQGCGGDARGPERPAPYLAGGGEPFWSLEIANGRLYFGVNEDVFIVPAPRPQVTRGGRTRRYQAPGITVTMRRENCQLEDERTWSDEVTVVAGSWRVLGCGGRVVREAPE
jgi:uncharacterized membrane protein